MMRVSPADLLSVFIRVNQIGRGFTWMKVHIEQRGQLRNSWVSGELCRHTYVQSICNLISDLSGVPDIFLQSRTSKNIGLCQPHIFSGCVPYFVLVHAGTYLQPYYGNGVFGVVDTFGHRHLNFFHGYLNSRFSEVWQ